MCCMCCVHLYFILTREVKGWWRAENWLFSFFFLFFWTDWHQTNGCTTNEPVTRQLSVSSDSKLLDEPHHDGGDADEPQVILRQKKPPRPKSEAFLSKDQRRSKRYSAFGVSSEFYSLERFWLFGREGYKKESKTIRLTLSPFPFLGNVCLPTTTNYNRKRKSLER